ncbi:hypothetical protein [Microvirga sp. VF16]|uniref:hypothetical protein n=1 Tax=Microvirga sp. VF16 TaxID=2807101 RepID=UPI00193DE4B0|nr:hypothetical protein [Microvirga sp. VF16]QRM28342.1 hypothetical protein JO965_19180 [Microvirga sp. VF16]
MKYRTPKLIICGQTYHQVIDIICRRKLLNCEPESQPVLGLLFQDKNDLIACALVFNDSIEIDGSLAIVPAVQKVEVENLIEQLSMEGRVEWVELLGVWFWDSADELAFNQELDAL